jgi:hypothetical protein
VRNALERPWRRQVARSKAYEFRGVVSRVADADDDRGLSRQLKRGADSRHNRKDHVPIDRDDKGDPGAGGSIVDTNTKIRLVLLVAPTPGRTERTCGALQARSAAAGPGRPCSSWNPIVRYRTRLTIARSCRGAKPQPHVGV